MLIGARNNQYLIKILKQPFNTFHQDFRQKLEYFSQNKAWAPSMTETGIKKLSEGKKKTRKDVETLVT